MKNINRNVLITGAGKGIGYASVRALINEGYYVIALVKNKKDNKKFKYSKNLKIINGNVNNKNLIKKIFFQANKDKKIITKLVNNAGIRLRKSFLKVNKNDIENIFNTNFFSIFFLMQIFSKNLINKKLSGSIVNISSIVGQNGFDELSSYGSTKGALISLTKCFSVEMAKYGIRANCISPGFTKTSYYENFKKKRKNIYKWTLSRIPMSKWGEADDISEMICFLLSSKSKYMTGENINIDGGWLSA